MIPRGWYFCAESSEIKPKQILAKKLFDQKIILWRTESGILNMSTSICPHLGSDLSKLGTVRNENLQCFSHDFTYNVAGDCVATGHNELPVCNKKVLKSYPIRELSGFVIAWYDSNGNEPTWHIPDHVFALKSDTFVRSDFEFNVPLETINEDNFDVGHLYKWHNVFDVKTTPVVRDGTTISISHTFKRHSIFFKKPLKPPFDFLSKSINSRYSSTLYGHGLTDSYINIFNLNIDLQDLIWCTPVNEHRTMYTTFVRMLKKPKDTQNIFQRYLDVFIFQMCVRRLRQEHRHEGHGFWEHQTLNNFPILTETERKIIGPYREWCNQFTS